MIYRSTGRVQSTHKGDEVPENLQQWEALPFLIFRHEGQREIWRLLRTRAIREDLLNRSSGQKGRDGPG